MQDRYQPLISQISSFARQSPDKVAIKSDHKSVTYLDLERASVRTANVLHEKVKDIPHVIIILDRSPELIQCILGLLKCGLVFVPLNPLFPGNRVKKMIEETRAQWVITSKNYYEKFKNVIKSNGNNLKTLLIDGESEDGELSLADPSIECDRFTFEPVYRDNCYIYFTSGSTGIPKCVLGRERGLAHFIRWEIKEFNIDENVNVSQLTPPSFDPFLRDIFVPLAAGATCRIPGNDLLMNPVKLVKWIDENNITLIHTVKSLFKKMVLEIRDSHCFSHLEYILLAGELLRGQDISKFIEIFNDRIQLVNIYGPTETTLAKLFYPIKPADMNRPIIPVGKPIDGARVLILDSKKQKCPTGKKGEIYIRTSFSSSGYYNDAELTGKVFIKNPHDKNSEEVIYKTGDLGRLLQDGNIEISGRADHQVKIRGVRIEVGEIENLLLKHPPVKDAVVVAREDENGDKFLCAYTVPAQSIRVKDLRQYLALNLPDYMIPSYFVFLEKIPLSLNGKVDRKNLPEPEISQDSEYAPPENDTQAKLVQIWAQVLKLDKDVISIDSGFFDLGGHSLRATSLLSQIQKEFQVVISMDEMFHIPTVRALSGIINKKKYEDEKKSYAPLFPTEKKDYYPLSVPQEKVFPEGKNRDNSSSDPAYSGTDYNIPYLYLIEEKMDPHRFKKAFHVLVQHHEVLRTFFQWVDGKVVQRIKNMENFSFDVNYRQCNETEIKKRTAAFIKPFDLFCPPLFRVELLEAAADKFYVLFDLHHIIMEAVSLGMVMIDFADIYSGKKLAPLPVQFKDYADWQSKTIANGSLETYEKYWLSKMEGFKVTRLPSGYPNTSGPIEFKSESADLGPAMYKAIDDFCHQRNITRFSLSIAVFKIILAEQIHENDIAIGARVTTRTHYELKNVVGPFLNKVFLRTVIEPENTFLNNLSQINKTLVEAVDHAVYPYELLETILRKKNNLHQKHLSSIVVNYLQPPEKHGQPRQQPMKMKTARLKETFSKYDIHLVIADDGKSVRLNLVYKRNLYTPERIKHVLNRFIHIMGRVLENAEICLQGLAEIS